MCSREWHGRFQLSLTLSAGSIIIRLSWPLHQSSYVTTSCWRVACRLRGGLLLPWLRRCRSWQIRLPKSSPPGGLVRALRSATVAVWCCYCVVWLPLRTRIKHPESHNRAHTTCSCCITIRLRQIHRQIMFDCTLLKVGACFQHYIRDCCLFTTTHTLMLACPFSVAHVKYEIPYPDLFVQAQPITCVIACRYEAQRKANMNYTQQVCCCNLEQTHVLVVFTALCSKDVMSSSAYTFLPRLAFSGK